MHDDDEDVASRITSSTKVVVAADPTTAPPLVSSVLVEEDAVVVEMTDNNNEGNEGVTTTTTTATAAAAAAEPPQHPSTTTQITTETATTTTTMDMDIENDTNESTTKSDNNNTNKDEKGNNDNNTDKDDNNNDNNDSNDSNTICNSQDTTKHTTHDDDDNMDVVQEETTSATDDATTTNGAAPKEHSQGTNQEAVEVTKMKPNGDDHLTTTTTTSTTNATLVNGAANSTTTTTTSKLETTEGTTASTTPAAAAALPQPPVMKGTLCIDMVHEQQYRHLIRGMWNYENSTTFPPQRFELVRNINPDTEDIHTLPVDGEFHGSFSLAYFHTTSKGKQKERSKLISESGVQIKFIPVPEQQNGETAGENHDHADTTTSTTKEYQVEGTGTNQFGIFHIYGTATRNPLMGVGDTTPTMSIIFRKRYEPGLPVVVPASTTRSENHDTTKGHDAVVGSPDASSALATTTAAVGPLPDPAPSFPSGVVSLRGQLFKEESNDLGSTEVVHRINGTWASGLDYIEADPQNLRGLCNRFEYEHKSAVPTQQFPVSGKYSGWFDLSNEDGTRTRINERDVLLKFRPNNQGYQNVEGKGSNVFGKYTITGTLTADNIITIFRHFQPRKFKKSTSSTNTTTLASPSLDATTTPTISNATSTIESNMASSSSSSSAAINARRSITSPAIVKLSFEDVKIPPNGDGNDTEPYDPIVPPAAGTYSAVSRGVLRINDDGSHSCQGKWAATREHFTNGQTSNFTFRLEPHFVAQESANHTGEGEKVFPLDSAMYKGSFQLKKQASRYQTIIDQQIVMKFKRNKHGAYNVHGTGINAIGEFNLLGTLVTSGKTGGQVELYRMYPPEKLAVQPVLTAAASSTSLLPKPDNAGSIGSSLPKSAASAVPASLSSAATTAKQQQLQRRESSRMSKLPSRLEEDDPDAQLSRTMDKCLQILKFMRERDVELGAFFSVPVDPIALGIPTYVHIIKEPMDLRTIENKMNAGSVETPEEFSRLVRLVFENAMTFNVDPGHSVHQAARNLLVIFNQKFRDVERMVQSIRRTHGIDVDESGKPRGKDDKKRKRQEEQKSMKRIRIEEAQAMTTANSAAVAALIAAMPTTDVGTVTRNEFSLLLNLIHQLQHQIVQTHLAVAELCPGDVNDEDALRNTSGHDTSKTNASSTSEKKKAAKRKIEVAEEAYVPQVEVTLPLTEKEQELLMETINEMPQEHLGGILEIIREAAPVDENDDVIDLGIDQLDDETQRKLFRHIQVVSKLLILY